MFLLNGSSNTYPVIVPTQQAANPIYNYLAALLEMSKSQWTGD
jgi:hypothetical protein